MAENVSGELGLDVSDLLIALQSATSSMGAYNKVLGDTIEVTKEFNAKGSAVGATFKAMTEGGQLATVQLKKVDDQYKILSSTIKTFVPEAERLSRLNIAPDLQNSVQKAFNFDPKIFEGTTASVDKLAFTYQNFITGALKSNLPFEQLDSLINKFAADGITGFDTLTGRELAQVKALNQVQQALAAVGVEQKKLQEAAATQVVGQQTVQVVRQTYLPKVPTTASQDEVNQFNVAAIRVGNAASSLAAAGVPIAEINKAVSDLAAGVVLTDEKFLQLAQAMVAASNIDFGKQVAQQQTLQRITQETSDLIKNVDGRIRQGLNKPLFGTVDEQLKYKQALVDVEQELSKLLKTSSAATIQKDVFSVMFGKGGSFTGKLPDKNAYNDLASTLLKLQVAYQELGATEEIATTKNNALTASVIALANAQTTVSSAYSSMLKKIPSNATAQEINRLTSSFAKLAPAMRDSGIEQKRAFEIISATIKGELITLSESERQFHSIAASVKNDFENLGNAARTASAAQQNRQNSLSAFYNRTASLLANQAIYGTFGAVRNSLRDSIDFQTAIGEIGTISQKAKTSLGEFEAGVIKLSNAFGMARKDVAEGLYQTLSNQIGKADDALKFLTEAERFAITTNSSTADSVNLLSAVLNAYHMDVSKTEEVSAQLFKTIEVGRVRANELSNSIGTVAIVASEAGVSFVELQAAIATLTIQGVTAANAQTYLRNIIAQLIKPTKEMKQFLGELGFTSGPAAIKVLGLAGVLDKLRIKIEGNVDKTSEFFTNIRSLLGGMNLLGNGAVSFANNMDQINNAMGSFRQAEKLMEENAGVVLKKQIETIKNEFNVLADNVIKGLAKVIDATGSLSNAVLLVSPVLIAMFAPNVLTRIGSMSAEILKLGSAIISLDQPIRRLSIGFRQLMRSPILPTIAITAIAEGIIYLYTAIEKEHRRLVDEQEKLQQSSRGFISAITENTKTALNNTTAEYEKTVAEINQISVRAYTELGKQLDLVFKNSEDSFAAAISKRKQAITELENLAKGADTSTVTSNARIVDVQRKLDDALFERKLKNRESGSEIELREGRAAIALQEFQIANQNRINELKWAYHQLLGNASDADIKLSLKSADLQEKAAEKALDAYKEQYKEITKAIEKVKDVNADMAEDAKRHIQEVLELQKKWADDTERRVGQSLSKMITSLKQVTSGKFSKFDTENIRNYQNALRAADQITRTGFAPRNFKLKIDQETFDLFKQMDPKARRQLRVDLLMRRPNEAEDLVNKLKEAKKLQNDKLASDRAAEAVLKQINAAEALAKDTNAGEDRFKTAISDFRAARKDLLALDTRFIPMELIQRVSDNIDSSIKKTQESYKEFLGGKTDLAKQQLDVEKQINETKKQILATEEQAAKLNKDLADEARARAVKEEDSVKSLQNSQNAFQQLQKEAKKAVSENRVDDSLITRLKDLQGALGNVSDFSPQTGTYFLKLNDDVNTVIETLQKQKDVQDSIDLNAKITSQLNNRKEVINKIIEGDTALVNSQTAAIDTLNAQIRKAQDELKKFESDVSTSFGGRSANMDEINAQQANIDKLKEQRTAAFATRDSFIDLQKELRNAAEQNRAPQLTEKMKEGLMKVVSTINGIKDKSFEQIWDLLLPPIPDAKKQEIIKQLKQMGVEIKDQVNKDFNIEITYSFENFTANLEKALTNASTEAAKILKGVLSQTKVGTTNTPLDFNDAPGFANGGVVTGQPGVDKVFMRATAGEFVMNEKSTRMFYNQLHAMNRGVDPTNNTVNMGGLNITLAGSGNSEVDARNLAKVLRRMVKRGQIALN